MAQVERYVRLSVSGLLHEDDEYIVGLAFEPGESLQELRAELRELVHSAVSAALSAGPLASLQVVDIDREAGRILVTRVADGDGTVAECLRALVDDRWPGRAHFIEVQHDSDDGWVQIFQPYDLPVRPELVPIPAPPPPKPGYQLSPWHTAPSA